MLPQEKIDEIAALVVTGFYDDEEILEIFCEERYEPGELDPNAVAHVIGLAFEAWEADKATWPEVTDCDRLDAVFDALNARGVIALQNAGCTQSDGYGDVCEVFASHSNKASVQGYCFYHGQDLEHAVTVGGLYLAFGPIDPQREKSEGPRIGQIVRDELEHAGLAVEWNGRFGTRLLIPNFDWKRR